MSDDESESKKNHYITCLAWVKKGVAASVPDKVELSAQELQNILRNKSAEAEQEKDEDDSGQEEEETPGVVKDEEMVDGSVNATDEFNFDKYDEEPGDILCHIDNIAVIDGKDPLITRDDDDDADSEKEDDIIKPTDNLLLVGHLKDDECILEVHVYNEEEKSFYCHHHNDLQYVPLCFEWLNYDPSDPSKPANFCAIGNYGPIIDVWDLDIVGAVDPVFQLGKKPSKKKGTKRVGHKDSVLDIAWNASLEHILASGSADKTVILWDLEAATPSTKLTIFEGVVQSIKWHETEAHMLLTGCMDKKVRLFDCNTKTAKTWTASGEVERVLWNHFDPNICFVSTDNGYLECIDIRQSKKALWQKKVQDEEMAGLSMSATCPGLLVSSNKDGTIKIWDVANHLEPQLVAEKQTNVGQIMCLEASCDSPFTFAIGGDNKAHYLSLFNASRMDSVTEHFKNREMKFIQPVVRPENQNVERKNEAENGELMDVTETMSSINLEPKLTSKMTKKKKKPRHRNRNFK